MVNIHRAGPVDGARELGQEPGSRLASGCCEVVQGERGRRHSRRHDPRHVRNVRRASRRAGRPRGGLALRTPLGASAGMTGGSGRGRGRDVPLREETPMATAETAADTPLIAEGVDLEPFEGQPAGLQGPGLVVHSRAMRRFTPPSTWPRSTGCRSPTGPASSALHADVPMETWNSATCMSPVLRASVPALGPRGVRMPRPHHRRVGPVLLASGAPRVLALSPWRVALVAARLSEGK